MVSAINAALWERRPAAIISDMMGKSRRDAALTAVDGRNDDQGRFFHALALEEKQMNVEH
jgi:hypothetical protein